MMGFLLQMTSRTSNSIRFAPCVVILNSFINGLFPIWLGFWHQQKPCSFPSSWALLRETVPPDWQKFGPFNDWLQVEENPLENEWTLKNWPERIISL
jgi:hypothetical protein